MFLVQNEFRLKEALMVKGKEKLFPSIKRFND
jgi:hypothetical protein